MTFNNFMSLRRQPLRRPPLRRPPLRRPWPARIFKVFVLTLVAVMQCSQTHAAPLQLPNIRLAFRQFRQKLETTKATFERRDLTDALTTFRTKKHLLRESWHRNLAQRLQSTSRLERKTEGGNETSGYTYDSCKTDDECIWPRFCISTESLASCTNDDECICEQLESYSCKSCKDCTDYPMETCMTEDIESESGLCGSTARMLNLDAFEVGCNSFPDPSPDPAEDTPDVAESDLSSQDGTRDDGVQKTTKSNVCIDAELLQHLPVSKRVYEEHVMGDVLCDTEGSCATPGHMVVYNGDVVMMREYCARRSHGCATRSIRVNSPRYERALRVPSRTVGLEFTALAARFESGVEGHALSIAIRLGL